MMMMMMMSNIACKSRITMSNATQVLRGQISLQHVQHSLTDAAESLLGARAKKPTGHQEVAGASLSRMLFWSKKLHGMRWQYSANTGKVWCYELWSSLICSWGSSTNNQICWSHWRSPLDFDPHQVTTWVAALISVDLNGPVSFQVLKLLFKKWWPMRLCFPTLAFSTWFSG